MIEKNTNVSGLWPFFMQCEKKPLRGEMYDDIMMISYLGPNVVMNFKIKE